MNVHEYQGKEILKNYGVRIQEGIVADTPQKALEAAKQLTNDTGTEWYVIKAQIHAGGERQFRLKECGRTTSTLSKIEKRIGANFCHCNTQFSIGSNC